MPDTQAGPWDDYAPASSTPSSGDDGPWNDYAPAAPQSATPSVTPSDTPPPAPTDDALRQPGFAAHAPAHFAPQDEAEAGSRTGIASGAYDPAKPIRDDIAGGVKDIYGAGKSDFDVRGFHATGGLTGDAAEAARRQGMRGATELLSGGGQAALTIDAPEITGTLGAALKGSIAAQVRLGKIVAGFGIGAGAAAGAGKAADAMHFTQEGKDLAQSVAFFVPSLLGAFGTKEQYAATPDASSEAYVAGKGKVGVGAAKTPDAYSYGVKVGDHSANVTIPRTPVAPPDPVKVQAQQSLDATIQTLTEAHQAEAAGEAIMQGATPEQAVAAQQPKAPDPTPDSMKQGTLTSQTVGNLASVLHALPEAERGPALLEAHKNLAGWIANQGGSFVGPDGQVQVVKNPENALQIAQKLINDQVATRDKAVADAQKQAQDATDAAAKADGAKSGKSALQKGADDALYQRAKTLLDAHPEKAGDTALLQRNLQIPEDQATALLSRYKGEQLPTVGSKAPGQSVVEETPQTIDAQMNALRAGTIKAVMLPEGSSYEPKLDAGMKKVVVSGDAPGAGTYIIKGIDPQTVKDAAKAGTHGDLLGHVQPKEELEGKPTAAVVARDPQTGAEIQASEVDNGAAGKAQAEVLAERHPGADISVEPVQKVLDERLAGNEAHPADDYAPEPLNASGEAGPWEDHAPQPQADDLQARVGEALKTAKPKDDYEQQYGLSHQTKVQHLADTFGVSPEAAERALLLHIGEEHGKKMAVRDAFRAEAMTRATKPHDENLVQALTMVDRGEDRWRELAKTGATDRELAEAVSREFGHHSTSDYGTKPLPSFQERNGPVLKGKPLLEDVRRLLGIEKPKREAKPQEEAVDAARPGPEQHRFVETISDLIAEGNANATLIPEKGGPEASIAAQRAAFVDAGWTWSAAQKQLEKDGWLLWFRSQGKLAAPIAQWSRIKGEPKGGTGSEGPASSPASEKEQTGAGLQSTPAPSEGTTDAPAKKAESAPSPEASTDTYKPGERIAGVDGKETTIKTEDGNHPGHYRLVSLKDLTPSHDGITFQPNKGFPGKGNERDYETEAGKSRVINQGQRFDHDYLLTDNPDATNGPPIVFPDGVVPGGNSRTMTLQRVRAGLPQTTKKNSNEPAHSWKDYHAALREKAAVFGYSPEDVDKVPDAVLVREMQAPATSDEFDRLVSALNKTPTAPLSAVEKAVSAGRKITRETMDEIARLVDTTPVAEGKTATIRNMLAAHGREALELLEKTGALTENERKSYVDTDGAVSDAGKMFVEDALLGHFVDDPKLLDPKTGAPRVVINKLDGALASLARIAAAHDEYNLIPVLRDALHQHAEIAQRDTNVATFQGQSGMFEQRSANPVVDALARKLAQRPNEVKTAFRDFADEAVDARIGQNAMFGSGGSAFEAFNHAFGTTLSDQEYRHGLARGVSEEEPRRAASLAERGDEGVSRSGPGEAQAGGQGSSEPAGEESKRTYSATVRDYAGSPKGEAVTIEAVNRRHAESLLAEKYPGKRIEDVDRASTPAKPELNQNNLPPQIQDGAASSEPAQPYDEPLKAALLDRGQAAIDAWDKLRASGATDDEIQSAVEDQLSSRFTKGKDWAWQFWGGALKFYHITDERSSHVQVAPATLKGPALIREVRRVMGIPKPDKGGPDGGGTPPAPATPDPFTPKKEERVRYRTKDGTEKTGRFKATFGDNAVRIAPDGGGKPDVVSKKALLGPAGEREETGAAGKVLDSRAAEGSTLSLRQFGQGKPYGVVLHDDDAGENIGVTRYDTEAQAREGFKELATKGGFPASNEGGKREEGQNPVAAPASREDTVANGDHSPAATAPGNDQPGGRRAPARPGGSDRAAVEPGEAGVLPPSQGGRAPEASGAGDRAGLLAGYEPRSSERVEPGSGAGAGPGDDRPDDVAPAAETQKAVTKQLNKPTALNRDWYAHADGWFPPTGEVSRVDNNLAAIKLVQELDKSPRALTDDEKETLANYVGWGSLPHIFDPYKSPRDQWDRWKRANEELRKLVGDDEFKAARLSTINAHYTSPDLVRFMWDALGRFGFKGGTVLEPSMGSGNFFGMMPKAIRGKVAALGNEMDPLTYKMARQLYPGATLFNQNFVDLVLPDNDLDLAIGNVPFGDSVYDPKYPKLKSMLHDYFFVKALDKVKPGGVVAFITSTGTMDRQSASIRRILASQANLVGAFRLPSSAFKKSAGTEVTTDLVLLQKRAPGEAATGEAWMEAPLLKLDDANGNRNVAELPVNEYFQAHPEHMLGKLVADKAMYGAYRQTLDPVRDTPLKAQLAEVLKSLPKGIMLEGRATGQAPSAAVYSPTDVKEGQFVVNDGKLLQSKSGKLVAPAVIETKDGSPSLAKVQRLKALVSLRDTYNEMLLDMNTLPDEPKANLRIQRQREDLKREYDGFVKQYGLLNSSPNGIFKEDPHYPRLLALEKYNRDTKQGTPADVFQRRTVFPPEKLKAVSPDPKEALQQVLSERGYPDVPLMAQLSGKPAGEIAETLSKAGLIYRNPVTGLHETRETYLSGYVRDKLDDARKAVEQGFEQYKPNVAALEKALPPDVKLTNDPNTSISIRLGATWVPIPALKRFVRDVFKSPCDIGYLQGAWSVKGLNYSPEVSTVYGTKDKLAGELMELAMNQKLAIVADKDGKTLPDATAAAQATQEKIREAFQAWAVGSKEWGPELERRYNYAYNNLAQTEYDGSHLTFPGMIKELNGRPFALKAHQVNAVWRILQEGRGLLAHEVGAGKTFEMAAAIMESRRLGLSKKPMLTVPNHIVEQFRSEFMTLYPGANLLTPSEADFDAKNRQRVMSQIATGDYDAIILPHSQFNLLDISPERQRATIEKQLEELEDTIRALKDEGDKRTVKSLEKSKEKLKTRMAKLADLKADKAIYFDHTGVDSLFVDEAHQFKNLAFYTKMTRVAGIQQANAKSALRLKMKTEYLQDRNKGRGVIFATGTPIQNTMAELPTMMKYVAPDVLEKAGIRFFDDWAANFGSTISAMELSPDGRSYKVRTKFARFQNVPELMQMFRSFADIKTADDLDLDTPEMEGGKPTLVTVPASEAVEQCIEGLMRRAEKLKTGSVDPKKDNMLKITSEGRKAATDMRLLDPEAVDDPGSKINTSVANLYKEWKDGTGVTLADGTKADLTQMAFLDMYRYVNPETEEEGVNLYNDMRNKLVRAGVPREQIAVIGEHDTRVKRQVLFDKMNKGEVRILFGSTHKMGAGTNAQRLLKALHHIDLPWRPGDVAQRNGRIIRQGNRNDTVRVYNYLTSKSFDAYMAQTLESKATFIAQTMSGKQTGRTMIDAAADSVLSFEEMKIAASGNPDVRKKFDLELQVAQLRSKERAWEGERRALRGRIGSYGNELSALRSIHAALTDSLGKVKAIEGTSGEGFRVDLDGQTFADRKSLMAYADKMEVPGSNFVLTYQGLGFYVRTLTETPGKIPMPTLEYMTPWTGGETYEAPERSMKSLLGSIEARTRTLPARETAAAEKVTTVGSTLAQLEKLQKEQTEWPEKGELEAVKKELKEVEGRLGLGDVLKGSQASAEAVAADVTDDPEEEEGGEDDEDGEDDKPKPRGKGVTLQSSIIPGLPEAAEWIGEQGAKFYKSDVAPALKALTEHGKVAARQIGQVFAPRAFANPDALRNFMEMKGEQEYSLTKLEHALRPMEKFFDKLPREKQVEFVTRVQEGREQATPELQQMADVLSAVLEGQRDAEIQAANLGRRGGDVQFSRRANYFPNRWKAKPGGEKGENDELERVASIARPRRPLEGSKSYNKQQSYTLRSGIEAGGKPAEHNPVRIVQTRVADGMKFVTARRAVYGLKQIGRWKFVPQADRLPAGWTEINDKMARVYFPAESGEGMIQAGRYAAPEHDARLLNNMLGQDWFRNNAVGRSLTAVKMATTAVELSFSPFHLGNVSVESVASQMGLGAMRAINLGIAKGDPEQIIKGLTEAITAPAAPYSMARAGGSAIRAMGDLPAFLATERGQDFLKAFPDAPQALRRLFHAGLTTQMPREYRTQAIQGMKEAWKDDNYFGAVVRAVPALAQGMMVPLFEHLIPRLKVGYALMAEAQLRAENADKLANGDVHEHELARKAVDAAENNFGEVNYSNFFWNQTFKGGMQLYFRAPSWKLTNWRSLGSAVSEQSKFLADPLKVMRDDARGKRKGQQRTADEYVPKLGLNAGRILAVGVLGAVIAAIWDKVATGKYWWEHAADDHDAGMGWAKATYLESQHPRTGGMDGYTGKPTRITPPLGTRDYEHVIEDPRGYLDSSLSGFVSKGFDTLVNRDWRGDKVYDPDGPWYQQMRDVLAYNAPVPITLSQALRDRGTGDYSHSRLSALGLSKTSTRMDMSPLEKYLQDKAHEKHIPRTPEEQDEYQEKMAAIRSGELTGPAARRAMKNFNKPYLLRVFGSAQLTYTEAKRAYHDLASPEEQKELHHALAVKQRNAVRRGSSGGLAPPSSE